jgi:hypothetical protein
MYLDQVKQAVLNAICKTLRQEDKISSSDNSSHFASAYGVDHFTDRYADEIYAAVKGELAVPVSFAETHSTAVFLDLDAPPYLFGPVVGTVYRAWREHDPDWEGEALYTDLIGAMDFVARAYVAEARRYGHPVRPIAWTLLGGTWSLTEDDGDPMIRITPVPVYDLTRTSTQPAGTEN